MADIDQMYSAKAGVSEIANAKAVTLHDSTNNALFGDRLANRIWINTTAGIVRLVKDDGSTVDCYFALGGPHKTLPYKRANSSGTTAVGVVAGVTF